MGIALLLIVGRTKAKAAFSGGDDIVLVAWWVIGDSLLLGFYLAVPLAYYYLRTSPGIGIASTTSRAVDDVAPPI